MRADRLVAALLVLQSRGRVTAGELAEELEVSVKTARRDLEALSMAGIPVYPQAGRNGGWQLLGGARTDLSGLTRNEATTLFMIAGPSSQATPEAKAALRKLVQALPETFREGAEQAASAVMLDAARWGAEPPKPPEFLDVLRQSVVAGMQLRLGYGDRRGAESTRVVHPLGLVDKGSTWYLIANTDRGLRTFRVNRVRSVESTDEPVERPADFDLAAAWRDVVDHVEAQRTSRPKVSAVVRVDQRWAGYLASSFGPAGRILGPADEPAEHQPADEPAERRPVADPGLVDVEVSAGAAQFIAERLAGWGDSIEVLRPPAVRDALAAIGRTLVERYGTVATASSSG